ncbi:MAG TPA: LamG-like jellyroll fold domain-containing protein, partial [Clostridia bacterium]|nr:LamG-like jellyroll fold domain-containing protein [Clostridia bacterium]
SKGLQFWVAGLFGTNAPGALYANLLDTNGGSHVLSTPINVLTNDVWQHVALTYDAPSGTAKIYTNGQIAVVQPVTGMDPYGLSTGGDIYFGFHADNLANLSCYEGGMDEFGLYDRALTDCEVQAIHAAGGGGKYGTNVLGCPVTNSVTLITDTTTTYNFTHGLNWTNGPQWETVTIDFTNPFMQAVTNGPGTNLASLIVTPLDPNVALDDFVLWGVETNLIDGLMNFTENTNRTIVPMKFAPYPYTAAGFPPMLVFSNDFESALPGRYVTGDTLTGIPNDPAVGTRPWTIAQGPVTVVSNSAVDMSATNWLALSRGSIQTEIPTIPGRKYELTYAVRGPGAVGWWNGQVEPLTGRARDLIGGNHGAFIYGATNHTLAQVGNQSLYFNGWVANAKASKLELSDPDNLRLTNALTIEGWIRPIEQTNFTGTEMLFFRGDERACSDPYYLALDGVTPSSRNLRFHIDDGVNRECGVDVFTRNAPIGVDEWQHVAAVFEPYVVIPDAPFITNQLRLYIGGVLVASNYTGMFPFRDLDVNSYPGAAIGNHSRYTYSQAYRGFMDELSVYGRALTDPEIVAIHAADRIGKADLGQSPSMSLAKVRLSLNGTEKETTTGANGKWTRRTATFIAERTNTVVRFQGLLPGTLINDMNLSEVPNGLNYLPEESLNALIGEDAFGRWTLEILDSRA